MTRRGGRNAHRGHRAARRPDVYMVTWIEPATGNTITHVEDFARNIDYANITHLGVERVLATAPILDAARNARRSVIMRVMHS